MAAHRQRSKPIKVFNPLEDISLWILIVFMYHSCKTTSPILIPGYKFMKTRQIVSLVIRWRHNNVRTRHPKMLG